MIGVADYQFVAMSAKKTHAPSGEQNMCQQNAGHCRFRGLFPVLWFDKIFLVAMTEITCSRK
jgi:hypothetical protein